MRENSELRMLLKNNQCFILALTVFLLAGAAGTQSDCLRSAAVRNRPRFDRSQLQIGAYGLDTYARTEQHVRDIRDCGVNFIAMARDCPGKRLRVQVEVRPELTVRPALGPNDGHLFPRTEYF